MRRIAKRASKTWTVQSDKAAYDILSTNHTTVWLVRGFDTRSCGTFIPDPGLFRTEAEANRYCERHSDSQVVYAHSKVRFGAMR